MGLKILHSADWHLDSPFSGFDPDQRSRLVQAQRTLPEMLAELCIREGCDMVLLAGDLLDGPCSRDTADAMARALETCAVPVLIAPGNHDHLAPDSIWYSYRWPENVHIFSGSMESIAFEKLNCRVYGAGYTAMDCPGLLENFRAEGPEKYQIGVLHGDPVQLRSPYCPVTAAQVRDSGLSYLALGHIHKAGSFRAGRTLCGWPGCPMGRGYDETREKGVYIVTVDDTAAIRFVPLNTPRFYDLQIDVDREDPEDVLPAVPSGDFYRVTLQGVRDEAMNRIGERFRHIPNLQWIDRREMPADIWESAGEDTLEGTYFRLLREKLETADEATAEQIRLAAEISRKLLNGRGVELP